MSTLEKSAKMLTRNMRQIAMTNVGLEMEALQEEMKKSAALNKQKETKATRKAAKRLKARRMKSLS